MCLTLNAPVVRRTHVLRRLWRLFLSFDRSYQRLLGTRMAAYARPPSPQSQEYHDADQHNDAQSHTDDEQSGAKGDCSS